MASCSNLQVPSSPNSLSFPSEPPDIKNWFPSYKYESLNDSELEGCVFEGHGSVTLDGHITVAEDSYGTEDEQGPNQAPDSVSSGLILSETPHLSNWFPSYAYESPALCSVVVDCSKSKIEGKKNEKHTYASEEWEEEREWSIQEQRNPGNGNLASATKKGMLLEEASEKKLFNKISDSSQSQSLTLSDLPDLRNWFSSYVYDSPVLGESDECVHEQVKPKEECLLDEENWKEKQVKFSAAMAKDYEPGNDLTNKDNGMVGKEIKSAETHCKMRGVEVPNQIPSPKHSSLDCDTSEHITKANFLPIKSKEKSIIDNCSRSPKESGLRKVIKDELGDGAQPEGMYVGSSEVRKNRIHEDDDDKENQTNRAPGNGFLTTRKNRRPIADTPPHRRQGILQECTRANRSNLRESAGAANAIAGRITLSERTNLEHCDAVAVTGKWHCPQKSKPKTGPPLKQLRLERWVQR